MIPLFIPGAPGGPELLVILLIAILLFGANKIPELARSSGQAIGEFQKGRQEIEEELEDMKDPDMGSEPSGPDGTDRSVSSEVGSEVESTAETSGDTSSN